jgi:thymidylate synthase (FAD)
MNVKLLAHTPDAIKVAFTAIRTCYSPKSSDELWNEEFDSYLGRNNDHIRLIKQIVNHGHTSTLEHISFTFSIEGVSRSLLAQLTRHRIGFSYSVQSQRYVNAAKNEFGYVIPPEMENDPNFLAAYKQTMSDLQEIYNAYIHNGIKPEDARYILPNAATTNLILTVNLRAFLDFYAKRNNTTHAQWEIAELAEKMKEIIVQSEGWTEELF